MFKYRIKQQSNHINKNITLIMGCGITRKKPVMKVQPKTDLNRSKFTHNKSHNNQEDHSILDLQKKRTGGLLATVISKAVGQKVEDNYKILNKLGKGSFGSVYKVLHKQTKMQRAMKIIKKESLQLQDDDRTFLKEIEILIETDHPNIIKIFEYYQDNVNYYLITEYVSGGELYDSIANWKNFSEEKAGYLMYQILSAVNYLHSKNIVHRDLKPENILVEKGTSKANESEEKINIKLIDFGTCNFYEKNRKLSLRVGTPYYIAPEVLRKNYNEKVDIWSCGVIFYILLVGYPPFSGNSTAEILESVSSGKYEMSGPEWEKISKEAKDLVKKMLLYDPAKRISAQEAMNHKFLSNIIEKNITQNVDELYVGRVLRNIKNFNAREKFQQATLAYIVHFFYSSTEIEDLKKVFQTLDKSGDGRLQFDELKQGFEKIFGKHLSDMEVYNIMGSLDQDQNGYIEYQEFLRAALNRKALIGEENLQMAFQKFDLNNDGRLSKNEIIEVLGNSDFEHINQIIQAVDKNQDGEISYSEFCEMMRKLVYNTVGETMLFDSPRKSNAEKEKGSKELKELKELKESPGLIKFGALEEVSSLNSKPSNHYSLIKAFENSARFGGHDEEEKVKSHLLGGNFNGNANEKSVLMNNSNLKVDQIDINGDSTRKSSETHKNGKN